MERAGAGGRFAGAVERATRAVRVATLVGALLLAAAGAAVGVPTARAFAGPARWFPLAAAAALALTAVALALLRALTTRSRRSAARPGGPTVAVGTPVPEWGPTDRRPRASRRRPARATAVLAALAVALGALSVGADVVALVLLATR